MRKLKFRKSRKVQPNAPEYTGTHKTDPVQMQLFVYNQQRYEEYQDVSLQKVRDELSDSKQADDVIWLNVHGLHNEQLILDIGALLGIESFIVSDILNTARRPRMEELDQVLFFSIKSILQEEEGDNLQVEQISFLMRGNLLVSFQEKRRDFFTHIRERIRTNTGMSRKKNNDFLLYLLLDAVMENFYITIESDEQEIENLIIEAKTVSHPNLLSRIEKNRENLSFLKRSLIPLRDSLYNLRSKQEDSSYSGIAPANYIYFSRLHQKCLELLDQVDYDMNSLESASNVFYSSQGQRMNQIMKTLTIVSVIFMPLTFIVGVYGMNFANMPELQTENGYFFVLALMFVIAIIMVVYFKLKKWF